MAKHKLSSANQKRYFASFYLELIENVKNNDDVLNKKALLAAHQQTCLFHLVSAYNAFLWEVANTYDEDFNASMTLFQLLENGRLQGKSMAELERIFHLESQAGSWLNQMLKLWNKIIDVNPAAHSKAKEAQNLNAIEVRVMMEDDEFMQLSDWYKNLAKLIEEVRELLVEW